MIKAIVFDFSRVLLNAKDSKYPDSLNNLYKRMAGLEGFNSLDHFELNKQLLEFANSVKDKYAMYIFTTGIIQEDVHFMSVISRIFKEVFTVAQVGFPKDNKGAYKVIAEKIAMQPEEILFIDDSEANTDAAQEAGLQALHFETSDKTINAIQALL